jgi:hypothetical protein
MKFLAIILLSLFLVSCDEDTPAPKAVSQDALAFKAGDVVLIHEPFYQNCYGYVVDFQTVRYEGKEQLYKVAVFCRTTGNLAKTIIAPDKDLQLRVRLENQTPDSQQ